MSKMLVRGLIRFALSLSTLAVGIGLAVAVIILILALEQNILSVSVETMNLNSPEAAQIAVERLESGADIDVVAEELGEEVQGFPSTDSYTKAAEVERISEELGEKLFVPIESGTVVGPYETRRGRNTIYYVARVEEQDILTLHDIYNQIDARILSTKINQENVISFWLPILLCSCGLVLTFSAGLWNIGIEGQMGMGAVGAASVALWVDAPQTQMIIMELLMAALAGGVWALITALMRTRGGVHEIFGGVAMNFMATLITAQLVTGPWKLPGSSGTTTQNYDEKALLPLLDGYNLSWITLLIAAICVVGVFIIMSFSKWGLQLRAMGKNERSAQVLGIPTERNIWLSMFLCGVMAGLGGAHHTLAYHGSLPVNVSGGLGFTSLLVVLLAAVQIYLVPFISLAFALLIFSPTVLKVRFQDKLDSSLIDAFTSFMVFSVFIFSGVRQRLAEKIDAWLTEPETDEALPPPLELETAPTHEESE